MNKKGFTLIELLVVISVLALLASIVFSNLGGAREGARISNALSFQSQTHSLLGSDLVGWWNFNEGDARDISGYGNNGTITGATSADGVPGTLGNSMSFNGSSNYITLSSSFWTTIFNNDTGNNFTVSFWVYPEDIGSDQALVSQRHGDAMSIFLMSNGKITIEMDDTRHFVGTDTVLENENWYHVTISFVNNMAESYSRYYVNGEFEREESKWDGNGTTVNSSLWIGWQSRDNYTRNPGFFNGLIDDVRIYNRALTTQEIQTIYAQTKDNYLANE